MSKHTIARLFPAHVVIRVGDVHDTTDWPNTPFLERQGYLTPVEETPAPIEVVIDEVLVGPERIAVSGAGAREMPAAESGGAPPTNKPAVISTRAEAAADKPKRQRAK